MKPREITRLGGRPYLKRYGRNQTLSQAREDHKTGAWRVRLHHFVGPDDAGHHNHPFKWALSIVLRGAYTEEVLQADGRVTLHLRRWLNWIPAAKYHRIVDLHGDVWTLFLTGPRVQSWGFWVHGEGHVPWRVYNARIGKDRL